MDDRDGEISRAMRNRCVELYVDESERWYNSPKDALAVAGIEATEAVSFLLKLLEILTSSYLQPALLKKYLNRY